MRDSEITLNPNKLVKHLKKPANDFTKQDIMQFIQEQDIEMINFRYVADDGKLKTLNFVILNHEHLDIVLSAGERVDGSSLFSFIEAGSSDLYVVPRFKTAFVNPFEEVPTLDILCSFYTAEGKPLESSPEYILKKACRNFKEKTGYDFKAMGELEYYVQSERVDEYPAEDQKGYHSAEPFANFEDFRKEAMRLIAQSGGQIKYGHTEVGNFRTEKEYFEQQEIEFLPVSPDDAVDQLIIAKWIVRMLGKLYGVNVSFSPKISVGKAGSGLHIHMLAEKDGKNILIENGSLSNEAKKMIAGLLYLAPSLTAFGNTIPTSYLRLVPHQEAPTYVCWGDRNRSTLVRVPLGWSSGAGKMLQNANPNETINTRDFSNKQTFEFRVPDGSADLYLLVAGLMVACLHGLEMDNALENAENLYAPINIFDGRFKEKLEKLEQLPTSCFESAESLEKQHSFFEMDGIFPKGKIDSIVKQLKSFDDKDLSERLYGKNEEIRKLVDKYIHWM
ncbi:MAG: glutamine synthetase family protein [Bacteroidota bacterium]|nr:glutamine synthetase family protein [Bacteroidota bacterium]